MSEKDDCTYGVNLVVFVFGIDVFDISHNVCVQSLQKEECWCKMGKNNANKAASNESNPITDLSQKFVMTSQQLKEEFEEAAGVNQIFIPQKDQSFAEGLTQTESLNPLKCCTHKIKKKKLQKTQCCNYCCGEIVFSPF